MDHLNLVVPIYAISEKMYNYFPIESRFHYFINVSSSPGLLGKSRSVVQDLEGPPGPGRPIFTC